MSKDNGSSVAYKIFSLVVLIVLAFLFIFPLYWIITGMFKPPAAINSPVPQWFPKEFTMRNITELFSRRTAPLFGEIALRVPGAVRWMINTVFMAVMAMILTCITAAMAGYALAKKRFIGRALLFSLIVAAMALPKQVILVPLVREISALGLYDNIWAVILPTVGWPFGVFLMKQFSESIPNEMLEAARIDGAGETRTFIDIVLPMIKPGIGALAIFTFITAWNDYFLQLIMLNDTKVLSISLGIAKLQSEMSTDFGIIMAGAALGSIPIIIIFLLFQKFFTRGITMGAVKG